MKFHFSHQTHYETIMKLVGLVMILLGYFGYMSWKYDAATGASVSLLTWTFFVLCTPVADGGFILAFPIRILFGFRMLLTQVIIWFFALGVNIFMLFSDPQAYEITFLTGLLKHILVQPYPYWSILIISALGTFLSILFGDEMVDVAHHKDRVKHHKHGFKYRTLLIISLGILTIVSYYYLLDGLKIKIEP